MMNKEISNEEAKRNLVYAKRWGDKPDDRALDAAIKALEQTIWIPCSERLPKENEYIGDVCKYYLIQDEYEDMHVAHLSNVGWIPMNSLNAIGDEVIAWRELPQPYKEGDKNEANRQNN